MKSINIKGKDYVMVNTRIIEFWKIHPEWSLETEIIKIEAGIVFMKATVKDDKGATRATGHAYEKEGSTFINKTSYLENCETSAVGRALGTLGIGIDDGFASYEEVANAQANQDASHSQVSIIESLLPNASVSDKQRTDIETRLHKFTQAEAEQCIKFLNDNLVNKTLDKQLTDTLNRQK